MLGFIGAWYVRSFYDAWSATCSVGSPCGIRHDHLLFYIRDTTECAAADIFAMEFAVIRYVVTLDRCKIASPSNCGCRFDALEAAIDAGEHDKNLEHRALVVVEQQLLIL